MKCTALATLLNMYRACLRAYAPNPIATGLRHIAMMAIALVDRLWSAQKHNRRYQFTAHTAKYYGAIRLSDPNQDSQ